MLTLFRKKPDQKEASKEALWLNDVFQRMISVKHECQVLKTENFTRAVQITANFGMPDLVHAKLSCFLNEKELIADAEIEIDPISRPKSSIAVDLFSEKDRWVLIKIFSHVEGSRLRELNASHEKTIKEISKAIGLV